MIVVFQKEFSRELDKVGQEIESLSKIIGFDFLPILIKPFSHKIIGDISPLENRNDIFVYGSNLILNLSKQNNWNGHIKCVHKEDELFGILGFDYLNHDMIITNNVEYEDISKYIMDHFFVKPKDDKYFPGTICDSKMLPFVIESQGKHHMTPARYDICISSIKRIKAEYRLFFVNGMYSTSSQYHEKEMRLKIDPAVPNEIIDYGTHIVSTYDIGKTLALDICILENGDMKVVETNRINSSGFYASDLEKLFTDLNELL